jgi:hypothetical protein
MATRKGAKGGKPAEAGGDDVDLSTHPLVAERNVDPSEIEPPPPELASLVGYVGPSRRDGSVRLYQDLTFRSYYEIPSESVVSTKPVNPDDENSPTQVQVEPDTKIEVVTVSVQSVEARYLSGSISGGLYGAAAGGTGGGGVQACGNITTYMPSCLVPQQPCTNITTHMPSCVAQAGAVGAQAAGAQLCTNITTYMPSCVQQPCTNITTHMPSCVGQGGGPQAARPNMCTNITTHMPSCVGGGPQGACTIVMTTMGCTFGGVETGTVVAPGGFCTNITTHMPSCVRGNPNCIATIVTSGVPGGGGGGQVCIDLYTANPSHCAPQCDPNCLATIVTSHHAAGGAVGFAAAAPGGQNLCTNITTHMPSCVGSGAQGGAQVACTNITTYMPSCVGQGGGPQAAQPNMCTNITTYMPSCVGGGGGGGQICATYYTANPSGCHPCAVQNTPATLYTQTAPQPQAFGAAGGTVACATYYTANPSGCNPCQPIANTAATLCTQHIPQQLAAEPLCVTLYTARPTGCG